MGNRNPHRNRTFRTGVAIATGGIVLMASGLGANVAGASPKAGGGKGKGPEITICHRTKAPANPYTSNDLPVSAIDGKGNNDHTQHLGPVFDFDADPSDPGYPYHPPMNDDAWGDIIPPYEWNGVSFAGLNWDEDGQAIHAAGCKAPVTDDGDEPGTGGGDEPGTGGGDEPGTGGGDEPGTGGGDEPGTGGGDEPGTGGGDEPGTGGGDDPGTSGDEDDEVGLIPPVVIENEELPADDEDPVVEADTAAPRPVAPEATPPARRPTQVAGIQVHASSAPATVAAQQLPRTGADTTAVAVTGFGLVLLGAGAVIAARRPLEAPVR